MKVTAVETLQLGEYPNLLFVTVVTDEGLCGLGETFFGARAVASYLHESVAPELLGGDPSRLEHWTRCLTSYVAREGSGAERRGNSAIDLALWDLLGQACDRPLHGLLGGRTRDAIRIYNTCAGPRYIRERPVQSVENWGLGDDGRGEPYDDLRAAIERPDELARDLLAEGITGMKIWPFDVIAERHEGMYASPAEIEAAIEPIRRIRDAVGMQIDVMIEMHGLWNAPGARRVARALEEYAPLWIEDPMSLTNPDAVAGLAASTSVPIAGGETIAGARRFADLLRTGALDVLILDLSWCGGLTEARRIAALAEAHEIPIAAHDCTGPVVLAASTHLAASAPNALVQETTRASYRTWYQELVTELPPISGGEIRPCTGPGLGTRLRPGLSERPDALFAVSELEGDRVVTRTRVGAAVA